MDQVQATSLSEALSSRIDRIVDDTGFTGVVHVARAEHVVYQMASGLLDRAHGVPNTLHTRFAIASGTKALTAMTVMSLVAEGVLALDAEVQSMLGGVGGLVG